MQHERRLGIEKKKDLLVLPEKAIAKAAEPPSYRELLLDTVIAVNSN